MRVTNHLPETTTMHWHGMHVPAVADGGPHQPIERGDTWRPRWRIDQPAATLWYHPHPHERTNDQVYRGLAGMWIIDEPGGPQRGLPGRYGVDDVPVLLQDKRFDDRGRLDFGQAAISPIGRLGDEILVNGSFRPYLTVTRQRTRLRLLNASSARHYRIGLADERPFALIAGDGGLLDAPKTIKHVQISPGERAEIVVTLQPGERVVLRSFKPELGTDAFNDYFSGGRDLLDLLELRADTDLQPSPEIPARLASLGAPFVPPDARVRNFSLGGSNAINGRSMDMERIDQVVPLGETEIWKVENPGGTPHNFHIHGTQFRVLDIDGRPPPPHLTGLKDTISLPGGSGLRLAVRFTDYADAQTPYMFHCHVLEHEDRGMMGQFVVVRPGSDRTPGRRQSPGSAHPSGHG
jgi:FtsP/CotA-like multicopper oxidase with cupredoxin domain